jgi:uncharacterized delta-60 repeat protein
VVVRYAADGSLDGTFGGGDGIVTATVGSASIAAGLAIDSVDRITVGGATRNTEGETDFAVLRYTPTGELDGTFGGGDGIAVTDIGSIGDLAGSVVSDGSGRIVVAGSTGNCCGETEDFAVARYDSAGSIDGTFGGGDGIVLTDFPTDSRDVGNDVALDDQGRAVMVGETSVDGQEGFLVARYDASGSLDPSFGGDGIVLTDVSGVETERANAVTIDSLGRIVVAGSSWTDNYYDFTLARYNPDGSLDLGFGGGDGTTTGKVAGDVSSMVLEADDDIVLVGDRSGDQVVARFDASGNPDTGFGSEGVVTTDLGGSDSGDDVALDASGRIVVSGRSDADFGLARLMPDGTQDSGFGGDGVVTTEIVAGGFAEARALVIDSLGRIMAAGEVLPNPAEFGLDLAVARYNPSGVLDPGFGGGDGITLTDVGREDSVESAALTASDGLVVAGVTVPDFGSDLLLARYVGGGPLTAPTWTLTVTKTGEGSGTVTGPGIDCGSDCSEDYEDATLVTLTAAPDEGSVFTGWSGACTATGSCQITMDAAKELTATFDPASVEPPPKEEPPAEEEPPPPEPSPAAAPVLPAGDQSDEPAAPSLAAARYLVLVKGGKAFVRLRCPGEAVCRGVAKLVAVKRGARRSAATRNVMIGRSKFRLPVGATKVVRIRLNARGKRLAKLGGRRGLQARLLGRGLRSRVVRLKPR